MKIRYSKYFKLLGFQKLLELCNFDLTNVRLRIIRETSVDYKDKKVKSRIWAIIKEIKEYLAGIVPNSDESKLIQEVKKKLRGDNGNWFI